MRAFACAAALSLAAAPAVAAMSITSHDLRDGGTIAARHIYPRCGGQNVSPDLAWSGQPAAAKSLVLTMIDLDVKPHLWSHWVVVGLPPGTPGLPEGVKALPAGAHAVAGNFGDAAYAGPCPPKGSGVHRYQFTVWALPTPTFAAAPDEKADELAAKLKAAAIDHAALTASVTAPK
jgi:Raf kinase inhibitor-like YbhB/YbcL family protein